MTKLPNGWEVKKLEEVATIVTGNTPSKKNLDFYGNDYPFFKPSDFDSTYELTTAGDNLSSLGFKNARQLPPKTILVVCIGSLGKVGLTRVQGSCNQQINAIIPNDNLLSEYVYYFCISSSFQKTMFLQAPKTTLPILNKKEFSKLTITFPSIEEQRKIVKILDEKFASIDESIRLAKDDLLSLDELWQSILNDSFNPLKSKLDNDTYTLPPTWKWEKLGDIATTSSGGTPKRTNKDYWENGTINWLKSGELNDYLINNVEEKITQLGLNSSSAKIYPKGTLLIAMYGATAGKLGILNIETSTNQAVCAIFNKNIKNVCFKENYLFYYLLFKRDKIILDSFGGAQPNISQTYIKNMQIPLPPLKEQERIAKELESKAKTIKELKELYIKRLKDYEELKESLLDLAFKGGL